MTRRCPFRRLLSIAGLAAAASMAMYAGACQSPEATTGPQAPSLEGVIYEGGANDEALVALLAKAPVASASQGTVFDTPAASELLAATAPATFAWHVGGATAALEAPSEPHSPAGLSPAPPRSVRESLVDLVGPPRAANAHGPPVNGRAYFLVLSDAKEHAVVRVFTTNLSYTPDAAAWQKLQSAAGPLTAGITSAVFENSRVAQDGGPYVGQPVTFSLAP
jgi:hypothetical protein